MTDQEKLILKAVIRAKGSCLEHSYGCQGCPLWGECGCVDDSAQSINIEKDDGKRPEIAALATLRLINQEIEQMLARKHD